MPTQKASLKRSNKDSNKQTAAPMYRWWTVKYWITVPEGQAPRYFLNALLVHEVVGPVLSRYLDKVPLYRFHCVYDPKRKNGHEWTVWFYSDQPTASAMYKELRTDELVATLKAGKILFDDEYEDLHKMKRTEIKDTSDNSKESGWHPIVQEAWPYYAKGVSECWWRLVDRFSEALKIQLKGHISSDDPDYLFTLYQAVEENINNQWQSKGQHVFMHHLHAIISWEPVEYIPRVKIELVRM